MPPEQINGQAADARADLFSLGCILYRLTTGQLPFTGRDTLATLVAVGTEKPLPPRSLCPDVPAALDALIMRLLAKTPEERPPSAAAVVEALSAIEADPTRQLLYPPGRKAKSRSPGKRRRLLRLAALALVFLAVILGGVVVVRMATDYGEIVIETDDPTVEVLIRHGGNVVEIVGPGSKQKVVLHSGAYTLSLAGDPQLLMIDLPNTFTLHRGDKKIVAVRRLLPPKLLHSFVWLDAEQGFPAHIHQTGISDDGKLFFGAGDGGPSGSVRIFEVATGKQIQDLRTGTNPWFSFAAFVPGSKYIATAYSSDKDLYLWDIATGKVVRKFTGHSERGDRSRRLPGRQPDPIVGRRPNPAAMGPEHSQGTQEAGRTYGECLIKRCLFSRQQKDPHLQLRQNPPLVGRGHGPGIADAARAWRGVFWRLFTRRQTGPVVEFRQDNPAVGPRNRQGNPALRRRL